MFGGRKGPVDNQKFYKALGVEKSASQGEIKKAYFKKAKECHPDKFPNDPAKLQQVSFIDSFKFNRDVYFYSFKNSLMPMKHFVIQKNVQFTTNLEKMENRLIPLKISSIWEEEDLLKVNLLDLPLV